MHEHPGQGDMTTTETTYRFIESEAAPFTARIQAAIQASRNEAEFRTHITRHIEEVATRLGVNLILREEYTLATGRFVSCDGPDEAHYVCSLLASSLYNLAINAYIVMHPSPHVLKNVRVPKYDPTNSAHQQLAELSRRAHELAAAGDTEALKAVEAEVDQAAAELWGITAEELAEIRRSLEELRG